METNVCIATISLVRNDEEEKLLRASLEQLAKLNLPVYITDGGSSEKFVAFLKSISHFNVFEAKGLWPQAKKSITEAAKKSSFNFYTEPDKLDFFSYHLKRMLKEVREEENTGVVLASRSTKAFATFPSFQQMTEATINNCCREVVGKETDYCYGPFLFNAQLVPYLNVLDDNCGWGWRPFLFAMAHRLGLKVESYEGDFNCPQEQREDDATERIYRMKQLTQNINGLVQAATKDLSKQ
jgi:hypothetical protein